MAAEYGLTLDGAVSLLSLCNGTDTRLSSMEENYVPSSTIIQKDGEKIVRKKRRTKTKKKKIQIATLSRTIPGPIVKSTSKVHPLSSVLIIELLIPLSHPSELVTHPAMIRTFRSNKIRVLAEQALESIRAEHEHMTKLSRLLSVLLGDEDIFTEPEEMVESVPPAIDDSESDKDVDIMDLDEPAAKEKEETPVNGNGETNGTSLIQETDTNGVQINGTGEGTPAGQTQSEDTSQQMDVEDPPQASAPDQQPSENPPTDPNPNQNTNGTATSRSPTLSRSPTPVTRPTTRLQTAASTVPDTNAIPSNEFSWPPQFLQATPSTTPEDLGLTKEQASEIRRMVQAALERSQEFLRCLEKVRLALVRADKQRKMVWLWCKDSAEQVEEQEKEEEGR